MCVEVQDKAREHEVIGSDLKFLRPTFHTVQLIGNPGKLTLRFSTDAASTPGRVTKSKSKTTKSGRSSAYNADFMGLLISNGVDRPQRKSKPANYDDLRDRLAQPRGSLSPSQFSESKYEDFLDAVENAREEAQVMSDVFATLKGPKIYPSTTNRPCNNWAPLVSANLVIPQPDFFDGERQTPGDAELRQILDSLIVPSTSSNAPFLPNFLVELKAPGASAEIARRQIVYDGAFAARAMLHLRAYGGEEIYDGNAYTLTSTYTDGKLEIFAHSMTPPDEAGKRPCHHTVSLGKWMLDEDIHAYRRGATAFRNARDLAREFREAFISDANRRMQSLTQEAREQKITEALTKTKEILDSNISVVSSLATAQSQPDSNDLNVQTSIDKGDAGESGAPNTPVTQPEQQGANKLRRSGKNLTKKKAGHQSGARKGPKVARKTR